MSQIGNIITGIAGSGLSVLGMLGDQPSLSALGGSMTSSVLSPGTTTKVHELADKTVRGLDAYNAAVNAYNGKTQVAGFTFPSWILWIFGGLILVLILKKRR